MPQHKQFSLTFEDLPGHRLHRFSFPRPRAPFLQVYLDKVRCSQGGVPCAVRLTLRTCVACGVLDVDLTGWQKNEAVTALTSTLGTQDPGKSSSEFFIKCEHSIKRYVAWATARGQLLETYQQLGLLAQVCCLFVVLTATGVCAYERDGVLIRGGAVLCFVCFLFYLVVCRTAAGRQHLARAVCTCDEKSCGPTLSTGSDCKRCPDACEARLNFGCNDVEGMYCSSSHHHHALMCIVAPSPSPVSLLPLSRSGANAWSHRSRPFENRCLLCGVTAESNQCAHSN